MSQALPNPADCCQSCDEIVTVEVPGPTGPAGPAGTNGTNGSNGLNAYTTVSAFTMPAIGSNATATVATTSWLPVGATVFMGYMGYLQVISIIDSTHAVLKNLGYAENFAPGTVLGVTTTLVPVGSRGPGGNPGATGATGPNGATGSTGATGTSGANGTNPYTTLTASFTIPAVGSFAAATVGSTAWMAPGQWIFLETAGYFKVVSITDSTHVSLYNNGTPGNRSPATVTPSGKLVVPSALPMGAVSAKATDLNVLTPYVPGGGIFTAAHALPGTPQLVRGVLICDTIDNGYAVGDELDIQSVQNDAEAFSLGANATDFWITVLTSAAFQILPKTGGAYAVLTPANWKLRLYGTIF